MIDTNVQMQKRLRKRHRAEFRFRLYGRLAIFVSSVFLVVLLCSIFGRGYTAFYKTEIRLAVNLDASIIDPEGTKLRETLEQASYGTLVKNALKQQFPEAKERQHLMYLFGLVSSTASNTVARTVLEHPETIGTTQEIWLSASSDVDMFEKGKISKDVDQSLRKVKDIQIGWLDTLKSQDRIRKSFNNHFFTEGDSRSPEQAGILGGALGSVLTILVCIGLAFPLAVLTAIYLEEFAPKNKLTDIIEVNINNLAAVPSIVFGLLGLSVYLGFFGLPRSSSLVGGLTLALMILPTIVITTRHALRVIPPSIKDGAMALGASRMQVTLHHVVPLAMPGIMTGTILGIARALGETAPLLMIGMVAFVADVPKSFFDPATVVPVQIYLWSDSPELGFGEKTAAAIMVLLVILIAMNALAIYLRRKFEHKW